MYLIAIAWGYVALMMALVEATSSQGTILGALITLLLYGLLPISILLYILGAPARRAARRRAAPAAPSAQADGSHHAPAQALTPEREEP